MKGLIINISNHPILGVKRKVEIRGYYQSWAEEFIKVFAVCHHYENDKEEYGELINTQSLKSFERIFIGRNEIKVDLVDGMELYQDGDVYKRYDTDVVCENYAGQFDFLDLIIKNTPVNIPAMITSVIQVEDLFKKNFDS
jgi:hypothetical protein